MPDLKISACALKEGQRAAIVECTDKLLFDLGFVKGANIKILKITRKGRILKVSSRRFALSFDLCEKIKVKTNDEDRKT